MEKLNKEYPNQPLLDDYYDHVLYKEDSDKAKAIVFDLMNNLFDRRGFRQTWDSIDDDIKQEIFESLIGITQKRI